MVRAFRSPARRICTRTMSAGLLGRPALAAPRAYFPLAIRPKQSDESPCADTRKPLNCKE